MPRHPRVHAAGLLYHVIARGNNRQAIFTRQADYEYFVKGLDATKARYPFLLYAYALMPNHLHLLMEVRTIPTARIMQSMLTRYSRYFNRRCQRQGHVFQGRYRAIICERDQYVLELVRYIHLNPVRAQLAERPSDWPWTGHGDYLGRSPRRLIDPGPLTGMLASPRAYERFVRDGVSGGYRPEWHPGEDRPFLGSADFADALRRRPASETKPRALRSLDALLAEVAADRGVSPQAVRRGDKRTPLVGARERFVVQAVEDEGHSPSAVARFLSCHPSSVTRALRRGTDDPPQAT